MGCILSCVHDDGLLRSILLHSVFYFQSFYIQSFYLQSSTFGHPRLVIHVHSFYVASHHPIHQFGRRSGDVPCCTCARSSILLNTAVTSKSTQKWLKSVSQLAIDLGVHLLFSDAFGKSVLRHFSTRLEIIKSRKRDILWLISVGCGCSKSVSQRSYN